MTYVVGWSPFHRDAGAVELACGLAHTTGEDLHVVAVFPSAWGGLRRGDAAGAEAERALAEARWYLDTAGVPGQVVASTGRSVPQVLLEAVKATSASMIVLGSGSDAGLGRISLSSKSSRLLHSSPVPVALAPRGYHAVDSRKGAEGGPDAVGKVGTVTGLDRVTCAFRDEESSHRALVGSADFARTAGVPLRVVTFGVEPRRMYPGEVSGAESMVLESWREQAARALDAATASLEPPAAATDVVVGRTWDDALYGVEWADGDLLAVGSSSAVPLAQVFLGSSAAKIVRHSPVPVVVMPGGR